MTRIRLAANQASKRADEARKRSNYPSKRANGRLSRVIPGAKGANGVGKGKDGGGICLFGRSILKDGPKREKRGEWKSGGNFCRIWGWAVRYR